MLHQEFAPPAALRELVKCFWYNRKDDAAAPSRLEILPDGYAEIIFYAGKLRSAAYRDGMAPLPSPFLVGLLERPLVFESGARLDIVAIRCFPWTVFNLLGLAPNRDGVHLLMHPLVHPLGQLQARVEASLRAGRVDRALADLERYLLATHAPVATDALAAKAGTAMRAADGRLAVSQVAAGAHASVRTLERKFKRASGHTVKDVSNLIRFEQARNRLHLDPHTSLAGLAHELGYTDQSHLNRAFKRYSGMTPATFAQTILSRLYKPGG